MQESIQWWSKVLSGDEDPQRWAEADVEVACNVADATRFRKEQATKRRRILTTRMDLEERRKTAY